MNWLPQKPSRCFRKDRVTKYKEDRKVSIGFSGMAMCCWSVCCRDGAETKPG